MSVEKREFFTEAKIVENIERNTILAFATTMGTYTSADISVDVIGVGAYMRFFVEQPGKETREFDFSLNQIAEAIVKEVRGE